MSGPAGDAIASPAAATTKVSFAAAGSYVYRLTVDDGQAVNNTASAQVTITVLGGGTPLFLRGDVDSSARVDLSDAINILGFLFLGQGDLPCPDAGDADDNGAIQLTDAIRVLGFLFLGEGPVAEPAGACGVDPTPDDVYGCRVPCP